MNRQLAFVLTGIVLTGIVVLFLLPAAFQDRYGLRAEAALIIEQLDKTCPGCGTEPYAQDKVQAHAMAFALLASAAAKLHDRSLCQTSADWLVKNASPKPGSTGWGLGFAWDAFDDGSKNPADAVYGITTALGIRGLLDAYTSCGKDVYLATAIEAIDSYSRYFTKTEAGGFFWYSDQASDETFTANISAMFLSPLMRASKLVNRPSYAELARATERDLARRAKRQGDVVYWDYSARNGNPNDAVHAAMIVLGILEYSKLATTNIDTDAAVRFLETFRSNDSIHSFSRISTVEKDRKEAPATLWALGTMSYAYVEARRLNDALDVLSFLPAYQLARGQYRNTPDALPKQDAPMVSYLLWGMAHVIER